jgi:membrane protease YdiL (CAAX protease family)
VLGLFVILAISWILLWVFDKKDLLALGISPTGKRVIDFCFGFIAAVICYCIYCFIVTKISGVEWKVNQEFTFTTFTNSSWWILKSVLFEEFVFRGALLYILIKKMGVQFACILSSVAFGIYHWFSYEIMGNYQQMLIVFIMTSIWGYMFAIAFAKTRSMYLPFALHLGHNLLSILVFSQGPLGKQFLITDGAKDLSGIISLLVYLFSIFALPLITWWYLSKKHKELKS